MNVDASVQVRAPETPGDGLGLVRAVLDVSGEDLGILIGRRGDTLSSLQFLVNLVVSRKLKARTAFGIDVEGYRRRREESLKGLALRMADRVKSTGQSITLEPMPPERAAHRAPGPGQGPERDHRQHRRGREPEGGHNSTALRAAAGA